MKFFLNILLLALGFTLCAGTAFSFGSNASWKKSVPFGNFSISKDNILTLDGRSAGIDLETKRLHNPEKGITLMAVVKIKKFPYLTAAEKQHDAIFCRQHQFIMGIDFDRFYVNFHNGKKWFAPLLVNVKLNDDQFHSYVMTAQRNRVESQGDDKLNIKMYFDGKLVLEQNIPNAAIADSSGKINLGYSSSFGKLWYLGGELIDARAYNKVLSVNDIEDYTAKFKEIKNQPQRSLRLNKQDQALLDSLPKKGSPQLLAAVSAIRNTAFRTKKVNWQKVAKLLKTAKVNDRLLAEHGVYQYKLKTALLTVITGKNFADAVSLYDTINKRELLMHDNPFFRLRIKNEKLSPVTPDVISGFIPQDKKRFALKYKFKQAEATVNFDCTENRVHYSLQATPGKNISFDNVEFPALELRALDPEAALFAPVMSGVEHPGAIKNNVSYELEYPRSIASMQYGAFYDKNGGLFWSPADPLARAKQLSYAAGGNRVKIVYQWYPVENSVFAPGCPVRLELFKGNWYEAAMLYKQMLNDIDALYWIKQPLPRKDSPEWLKNNTLWFLHGGSKLDSMAQFKKIREYLGLPFGVHVYRWNSKTFDRDYPHHRGLPSFRDLIAECHSMGIRITPYINGRLWETLDRREEDYLYSKVGKANCVQRKDGTIAMSVFNKANFGIICPYTPIYEAMMRKSCFMLEKMGVDGIYIDQIGAAHHIVCYNKTHGHAVPDDTAWFEKGHHKVFSRIRAEAKARTPDMILTTEDNAETCIRNFDALLCWRWMYKCQVPAFSAVYTGKTQLIGLTYDYKKDADASFAKAAWQIIGGGQIGWFTKDYFCAPEKHDFRVWVKQLMRMRLALIDFFNEGEMAAPAKFSKTVKEKILFWGSHGTLHVNTPELYSTSWRNNKIHATILTNNTSKTVTNSMTFTPCGKQGKVYVFENTGTENTFAYTGKVKYDFSLKPQTFRILLSIPDSENANTLLNAVRMQFKLIAAIPTENDPFVKIQKKMAVYDPLSMITEVKTDQFECQFFPGAMYPTSFTLKDGSPLPQVRFSDQVKIGSNVYYLDCDRWAERKILENTQDKFTIELNGTFCTSAREYAAKGVKACYRYTFHRTKAEIEVEANVTMPAGTAAEPQLLQLECNSKTTPLTWKFEPLQKQQNTYSRKGIIRIK